MRTFVGSLLLLSWLAAYAAAQTCTGLCLQQVSCPSGQTTSISGIVYAPNGTDPLPNVLVYIPNAPVDAFTAGVSCPVVGQPPSGSPLVGTTTAVDGSFLLTNVPAGANIPLVIQSGRWRRQLVVSSTTACTDTPFSTRFPRNHGEGDIPKFAIATGMEDQVECVLRKVGIDDSEFNNPGGPGRIDVYSGSGNPGAVIDTSTPSQAVLMDNVSTLNSYDVLMLPCQGKPFEQNATDLANFIQFANAGGRVYSSHFSYVWMYDNPPFNGVANWDVNQSKLPDGIATVDTSFAEGATLAQWLQLVGASTTQGQMPISTLKHDLNGVIKPTQSWLTLNNAAAGNPVMQFVFNTPVGAATNQCGRILFNEYHVETPVTSPANKPFPTECPSTPATPQEKLLEYSLFELTNNGSTSTLLPTSADFGSQAVGFSTAPTLFTWTNNSTFPATVTLLNATGDFSVSKSNCSLVNAGASCQINVIFTPSAIGPRTSTLSVGSGPTTLTAALTGIGLPDLSLSPSSVDFGSLDVGASASRQVSITNNAAGSVPLPPLLLSGDYTASTTCARSIPAQSSCTVTVNFKPSTTGSRPSTLSLNSNSAAYAGVSTALTGVGVDFTLAALPTSGQTIAGYATSLNMATTPLAGFAAPLTVICTTNAAASACTLASTSFTPASVVTTAVSITTTSQYTVVGYSGFGGEGLLGLVALGSGLLLYLRRKSLGPVARCTLISVIALSATFSLSGCSGELPLQNPVFTKPGTYTYTMTATDGFLVHSASYTLNVTAK